MFPSGGFRTIPPDDNGRLQVHPIQLLWTLSSRCRNCAVQVQRPAQRLQSCCSLGVHPVADAIGNATCIEVAFKIQNAAFVITSFSSCLSECPTKMMARFHIVDIAAQKLDRDSVWTKWSAFVSTNRDAGVAPAQTCLHVLCATTAPSSRDQHQSSSFRLHQINLIFRFDEVQAQAGRHVKFALDSSKVQSQIETSEELIRHKYAEPSNDSCDCAHANIETKQRTESLVLTLIF